MEIVNMNAQNDSFVVGSNSVRDRAMELWKSGRQVWWLVTEELFRVTSAIKGAAAKLSENRGRKIGVVLHDRWAGFHQGLPPVAPCGTSPTPWDWPSRWP